MPQLQVIMTCAELQVSSCAPEIMTSCCSSSYHKASIYLQMTCSASAAAGFLDSWSVTSSTPINKPHPLLHIKQTSIMNDVVFTQQTAVTPANGLRYQITKKAKLTCLICVFLSHNTV